MNICPHCFDNSILQRRIVEIRPDFPDDQKCAKHPTRKGVPIEEVGKLVDTVVRANFRIGEWMFDHQEGDDLSQVVIDITGAEEGDVSDALVDWLIRNDDYSPRDGEFGFYATDQSYVQTPPDTWHHNRLWNQFRNDIMHDQRFFNDAAKGLLDEIFEGVQFQADAAKRPAFYQLTPTQKFEIFRGRICANDDACFDIAEEPIENMGAPPPGMRSAGRMNAAGIRVFYGALDRRTALAELRPVVGSVAGMAKFKLRRPIYVLDLTRFSGPGKALDLFARDYLKRTTQWAFMQSFAHEISKPILPTDEHLEYVPAQVVAEYLTRQPRRWRKKRVVPDAIIYGSAQNMGGRNIALMGDAAACFLHAPETTERKQGDDPFFDFLDFPALSRSAVEPALEYVADSLEWLQITSAAFKSDTYYVMPRGKEPDF